MITEAPHGRGLCKQGGLCLPLRGGEGTEAHRGQGPGASPPNLTGIQSPRVLIGNSENKGNFKYPVGTCCASQNIYLGVMLVLFSSVFCCLCKTHTWQEMGIGTGKFMEGRQRGKLNFENSSCHGNVMSSKSGISELVSHGKARQPRRKELK